MLRRADASVRTGSSGGLKRRSGTRASRRISSATLHVSLDRVYRPAREHGGGYRDASARGEPPSELGVAGADVGECIALSRDAAAWVREVLPAAIVDVNELHRCPHAAGEGERQR